MPRFNLTPLNSLTITSIVTDEVDHMSPSTSTLVAKAPGLIAGISSLKPSRCGASHELRMDRLCCGAFGISLGLTAAPSHQPTQKRELLFDAGPMGPLWKSNASNLKYDVAKVERIHLSHWHVDHSGGLKDAIGAIQAAKPLGENPVVVDVHPDRPAYRGMMTPRGPFSMEPDPTLDELRQAGAWVETHKEPHLILDGTFLVSGEIPRVTKYEGGIINGVRLDEGSDEWRPDELIMDERMVICLLKDKGLVIFSGCSHAGIINVCLHARDLVPGVPIYCVVGGYHLAEATPEKLQASLNDLKKLRPRMCMPGHCTGWRFKFMIEKDMPGQMVPLFAGGKYQI